MAVRLVVGYKRLAPAAFDARADGSVALTFVTRTGDLGPANNGTLGRGKYWLDRPQLVVLPTGGGGEALWCLAPFAMPILKAVWNDDDYRFELLGLPATLTSRPRAGPALTVRIERTPHPHRPEFHVLVYEYRIVVDMPAVRKAVLEVRAAQQDRKAEGLELQAATAEAEADELDACAREARGRAAELRAKAQAARREADGSRALKRQRGR